MCELFGLSASRAIPLQDTPLVRFPERGGGTADNPDGWGMAWRKPDGGPHRFRLAKEPAPACESALFAQLIRTKASDLVISHVRKARIPPIRALQDTHPFLRDCCGYQWAFAHNGLVPEVVDVERPAREHVCRPRGETDSDFAFCHVLGHLKDLPGKDWLGEIGRISEIIAGIGKFNFLLSDGVRLIAYGHDRLHYLESADTGNAVVLVATEPLSGHAGWTAFAPGELRIYEGGARVGRIQTHPVEAAVSRVDA